MPTTITTGGRVLLVGTFNALIIKPQALPALYRRAIRATKSSTCLGRSRIAVVLENSMSETLVETPKPTEPVEDGATEAKLHLWLVKEAMRQGEMRLTQQLEVANRARERATSLLGWSAAASAGLVAVAVQSPWRNLALFPAFAFVVCGLCCVIALWPRGMTSPGGYAAWLLKGPHPSEREVLEAMAKGMVETEAKNATAVSATIYPLKCAWVLFVTAALLGVLLTAF